MSTTTVRRYGWKADLPDQRDHLYSVPFHWFQTLPASVDLRPGQPGIYDQGQLGSCTANALAGAMEFDAQKQGEAPVVPSRLFIYYNERLLEHSVTSNSGASLRDGIKTVARQGACDESLWPYDLSQFAVQPPARCYQAASQHKALSYQRLSQHLTPMKACLASGYPFVFGFSVYDSFESDQVARTGVVPMPAQSETLLGGHAVVCVGYQDSEQMFIIRNSWGANWGQTGYCFMPYAYLLSGSLSSDFWTIRTVQ